MTRRKLFTKKAKKEFSRKANKVLSLLVGLPLIFALLFASLKWLYDAYMTGIIFVGGTNCTVCYRAFEEAPVSFIFHVVAYIFFAICCVTVLIFALKKLNERYFK